MARSIWAWSAETARRINPGQRRPVSTAKRRDARLEPTPEIAAQGWRWLAVRTEAFCERRVRDDLKVLGFNAYCPMGCRFTYWLGGKQVRRKVKKQFPVFARYVFVGCPAGLGLGKHSVEKIEAVLSDAGGSTPIPPQAIAKLNQLELAGFWDETRPENDRSLFKPGARVTIRSGPFAQLLGIVDAVESEEKIRLLTRLFGQETPVRVSACQIELAQV